MLETTACWIEALQENIYQIIGKLIWTHQVIHPKVYEKKIIPNEQFGFRNCPSSVYQVKRLCNNIHIDLKCLTLD